MNTLLKQRGMGMWSWLLVLIIAGLFLMCGFKIVPIYAENRYVVSALKSLVEPGVSLTDMSDAEIRKKLTSFYIINNVRSEGPTKNIQIKREAKRILVTVDYEARVSLFENAPLLGTMDVAVVFKNHLDSASPNLCCKPIENKSDRANF